MIIECYMGFGWVSGWKGILGRGGGLGMVRSSFLVLGLSFFFRDECIIVI